MSLNLRKKIPLLFCTVFLLAAQIPLAAQTAANGSFLLRAEWIKQHPEG